ncbi:hypothetical protein CLOM_g21715, partial [Closterium sp. NIES-68]
LTGTELEEYQKELIRRSSTPLAARILFTPKKDGVYRMCIDYMTLNPVIIKSCYLTVRADELLDQLSTARVFSKIDLKLHPLERNYSMYDKELLAIVHAFKVWRCYLTGADVTVRTDTEAYSTSMPNRYSTHDK